MYTFPAPDWDEEPVLMSLLHEQVCAGMINIIKMKWRFSC